jgi:hypothetical protein
MKTLGLFIEVKNVQFVNNIQFMKRCMFPREYPIIFKLPLFSNAYHTLTAIASLSNESAFVASVGASWAFQPNSNPRFGFNEARLNLLSKDVAVPALIFKLQLNVTPFITTKGVQSKKVYVKY